LGRKRRSCVTGHLLRVRLTERALCLNDCASDTCFRLSQCAPEKTLYWRVRAFIIARRYSYAPDDRIFRLLGRALASDSCVTA
jgi:hypothetical protein